VGKRKHKFIPTSKQGFSAPPYIPDRREAGNVNWTDGKTLISWEGSRYSTYPAQDVNHIFENGTIVATLPGGPATILGAAKVRGIYVVTSIKPQASSIDYYFIKRGGQVVGSGSLSLYQGESPVAQSICFNSSGTRAITLVYPTITSANSGSRIIIDLAVDVPGSTMSVLSSEAPRKQVKGTLSTGYDTTYGGSLRKLGIGSGNSGGGAQYLRTYSRIEGFSHFEFNIYVYTYYVNITPVKAYEDYAYYFSYGIVSGSSGMDTLTDEGFIAVDYKGDTRMVLKLENRATSAGDEGVVYYSIDPTSAYVPPIQPPPDTPPPSTRRIIPASSDIIYTLNGSILEESSYTGTSGDEILGLTPLDLRSVAYSMQRGEKYTSVKSSKIVANGVTVSTPGFTNPWSQRDRYGNFLANTALDGIIIAASGSHHRSLAVEKTKPILNKITSF